MKSWGYEEALGEGCNGKGNAALAEWRSVMECVITVSEHRREERKEQS